MFIKFTAVYKKYYDVFWLTRKYLSRRERLKDYLEYISKYRAVRSSQIWKIYYKSSKYKHKLYYTITWVELAEVRYRITFLQNSNK